MNAGPGGIAGAFVHSKHHSNPELPRALGWWSHALKTRFQMSNGALPRRLRLNLSCLQLTAGCAIPATEFEHNAGAAAYAMSNPPVLQCVSLRASLDVFKQTDMGALREKGLLLSTYLLHLLEELLGDRIRLLTPRSPDERGCQLSLYCDFPVKPVFELLEAQGVVCDIRVCALQPYRSLCCLGGSVSHGSHDFMDAGDMPAGAKRAAPGCGAALQQVFRCASLCEVPSPCYGDR
jgi:kynureninase